MKFIQLVKKYWQMITGFILSLLIYFFFKRKNINNIKPEIKVINKNIDDISKSTKEVENKKKIESDNAVVIEKKIEAVDKQIKSINVDPTISTKQKIDYLKNRAKKPD